MVGCPLTVVTEMTELFVGLGSFSFAETLVKFVIGPILFAIAFTDRVAVPPPRMGPNAQITLPLEYAQIPWLELADTKSSPVGNGLVTTTSDAVQGPAFLIV